MAVNAFVRRGGRQPWIWCTFLFSMLASVAESFLAPNPLLKSGQHKQRCFVPTRLWTDSIFSKKSMWSMSWRLDKRYSTPFPSWIDLPLVEKLGPRLGTIGSLVKEGAAVLDVGTDHGHLAIGLAECRKARFVIASDVNEEPLMNCKRNVAAAGPSVTERVSIRLGHGLQVLKPGEADTVTIAGMGAAKIVEILFGITDGHNRSHPVPLSTAVAAPAVQHAMPQDLGIRHAVLQPTSHVASLRAALVRHGWCITDEALTCRGRWAHLILSAEYRGGSGGSASHDTADCHLTEEDLILGPHLRRRATAAVAAAGGGGALGDTALYCGWLAHQFSYYSSVVAGAQKQVGGGALGGSAAAAARQADVLGAALTALRAAAHEAPAPPPPGPLA